MPRPRTKQWSHPKYKIGFCFERKGIIYTEINGVRASTGLRWNEKNKAEAISILTTRIDASFYPKENITKKEPMNVYHLLTEFFNIHFPNVSKSTQRKFKQACNHFLNGNLNLADVDSIKEDIIDKMAKATNLHSNTKNKHLQAIRQIFNYGVEEGYLTRNPVNKKMIPKQISPTNYIFTVEEVKKLIEYFENNDKKEFSLFIKFISITAVRVNEAINISWDNINEERIIIVGKGNRERFFPVKSFPEIGQVLSELRNFKDIQNSKLFKWNSYYKLGKWLNEAKVKSGIDNKGSFHAIRRMRENQLIYDKDLDITIVAQILGHSIRVQAKNYLETLGVQKMNEIIERRRNR